MTAPPAALCRSVEVEAPDSASTGPLRWVHGPNPAMDPWCRAVGPAFAHVPPVASAPDLTSDLAVVSWNVHVGAGDIEALVRDLRNGSLDGQPTRSFLLLLQEAFRAGPAVPAHPGSSAAGTERIVSGHGKRQDRSIDQVARREGLHLLYIPSMRNGGSGDPPEDRGNAILSSFPLEDWEALELPLERQRRVAVAARIALGNREDDSTSVQVVNLHFDARSPWRRLYRSLGNWRAEQARAIVERYGKEDVVFLGGDLNTWFGGRHERAVRILEGAFPHSGRNLERATVPAPWILPDLVLDHLFFRLPKGWSASYRVIENRYGSDHRPVLARIRMNDGDPDAGFSGTAKRENNL